MCIRNPCYRNTERGLTSMKNSKYHMMYLQPQILTNSKLKFGIIFGLTTTLMIATVLLCSGFNSIFAFSNKFSNQERYDSGVRDSNKDCLNDSNTSAYRQSGAYLGHSKYYQQRYDDTIANCGGGGNDNQNTTQYYNQNQDSNNNLQSQGQVTTQKPLCVTVFGRCNTASGKTQNAQN